MSLNSSNSFATLAQADDYHATRLHNSEWVDADDTDKEKALQMATRLLDDLDWRGSIKSTSQDLSFPRVGLYDKDGRQIDDNGFPQFLIEATAELAWLLLINDTTREPSTAGFKSISVGPISLAIDKTDRNHAIADSVTNMIDYYLNSGGKSGNLQVARG